MKDFIFMMMFVYGDGSAKRSGCYDDIVRILTENGIPFVEYGGSSREFAEKQRRASGLPKRTASR